MRAASGGPVVHLPRAAGPTRENAMILLLTLLGAAVLLSGLVMLVGYRRRGHEPASRGQVQGRESTATGPTTNAWMFGGGGSA
jgi:hypothetical protein